MSTKRWVGGLGVGGEGGGNEDKYCTLHSVKKGKNVTNDVII